ncbi:hypothetical protein SPRG_10798 [Saprolegnia parasitica CBS 223.65]|uniref:EF-hand domain-containing protein n=1 Tax=Saprolegnia parasitica (strain CBS 223.65) TaxID=695850 RepID=A0A067BZ97_SAPPC|nr:hypothetical protein SPRG_10798 [Saprolegnia parasitica CBS 223.65]KDO23603.1 hypothetical protein SPRG_10798 [Saprolegnia parasitica CBS 223.65]|eukprot:XP_012205751.1 hypothetical protein SPRG_10798 [Saprolegnia parasitica CBS 223.65]
MPSLSPDELSAVFALQEGHGTFQLSRLEYLQIQAAKKLALEAADEEDLQRHFTVLDYHGNGSLVADEILDALEKTGDAGVSILKAAVAAAAKSVSDGKITFDIFRSAIHDMNRATQASIAADTLRLYQLQAKQEALLQQRQRAKPDVQTSLHVECSVLEAHIERQKRGLITVQNDNFSKIYAAILAQYVCETTVLRSFEAFFNHLHTEDSLLFRRGLERSGRMVDVHPSFLLYPGPAIDRSPEYAALCHFMVPDLHGDGPIFTNRAYRKVFLAYCLLGSLTNFQTISRGNFVRFVKDCQLPTIANSKNLRDPDIDACFVLATRASTTTASLAMSPRTNYGPRGIHLHFQPTPACFTPLLVDETFPLATPPTHRSGGMSFAQWVHGTTLVLQKSLGFSELPQGDAHEALFRDHILPHARQIEFQPMGPEISQPQVMRFIRAHVWPLKQLFAHFGGHSLSHIETGTQLSLANFLQFARCFDILRSTKDNHPKAGPSQFRQLSLQEVVQEYNAAKLDVGFSHTESRESLDLNFHEFLRCMQRLAMAMGSMTQPSELFHGQSLVSSFQNQRADLNSTPRVHLFQHSRQLHVQDRHFSKAIELLQLRATTPRLMHIVHRLRHLPRLPLDELPPPRLSPRKPAPEATIQKCITPRRTHLPLVAQSSPRYSANRSLSLGGSPRPRIIKAPPSPMVGPLGEPNPGEYDEYRIPLLSSQGRARTPYQPATVVTAHHAK